MGKAQEEDDKLVVLQAGNVKVGMEVANQSLLGKTQMASPTPACMALLFSEPSPSWGTVPQNRGLLAAEPCTGQGSLCYFYRLQCACWVGGLVSAGGDVCGS